MLVASFDLFPFFQYFIRPAPFFIQQRFTVTGASGLVLIPAS